MGLSYCIFMATSDPFCEYDVRIEFELRACALRWSETNSLLES